MNDDTLDERLRSGFRSLADAAGDPPRFDTITTHRPAPNAERRSPWFAAVAVAGVVALIAGALFAVAEMRGGTSDGASGPLFASPWYLESMRADGVDVGAVPAVEWVFLADVSCDEQPAEICEQGPVIEGTDACNHFTRTLGLEDGASISWGSFWMTTTAAACIGGITDTFDRFMRADGFSYRLDGDRLVLAADGVELVFSSVRPPPITTPRPRPCRRCRRPPHRSPRPPIRSVRSCRRRRSRRSPTRRSHPPVSRPGFSTRRRAVAPNHTTV